MATDYTKYLATNILSDQRTLSYRNVARACKVHVNTAKCMLFDFYDNQSKQKPGSLYATYLIAGVKRQEQRPQNGVRNGHHHDEDEHLPSSPPPFTSSMLEPSEQSEPELSPAIPTRTITLFREEALKDVKAEYESITSIHIYSASPSNLQDLVVLTDIGREIHTDVFAKEDSLQHNKTYGVIQNPQVRRRKGKRPIPSASAPPKFQPTKEVTKPGSKPATATKKEETTSRPVSRDSTSAPPAKQPSLKRGGSDIFKAFAKSQPPKAKDGSQDTKMPDAPTPKLSSDDEGESEDEALFLDTGTRQPAKKRVSDSNKEREDKTAKLRKMMDSDDEESAAAVPKIEDAAADAGGDVAWSDSDSESKTKEELPPTAAPEEPRRRRGKRKVMKKRTVKDEDGYLVTKEEPVWEEFSESESDEKKPQNNAKPAFAAAKSQSSSQSQKTTPASATAKGAGAKKGGKADIMSFFGKK